MPEIKFRGKTLDGNVIIGDLVHRGNHIAIRPFDCFDLPLGFKVDPDTVGLFTGLQDIDRNDIFEGDLLEAIQSGKTLARLLFNPIGTVEYNPQFCNWDIVHRSGNRVLVEQLNSYNSNKYRIRKE